MKRQLSLLRRLRGALLLSIAPVLVLGVAAHAAAAQAAQDPGATASDQPKIPAPPLFPKHRRGLYRNGQGFEVVDATPQSPPLRTDDPGVPDKGEYEINLTTHVDLSRNEQRFDLLFVDANYGVLPSVADHALPAQLKFEFPLAAVTGDGKPTTVGVGAATLGIKLNFFVNEHKGVSVSVYPQIEFGTPGAHGVEKGLAEPGQTFAVPLLVSKEFHDFTFVTNVAVSTPLHDRERSTTSAAAAGVGRALTRRLSAMVEIHAESSLDLARERLVVLNGGVIHGLRNLVVYAQLGRSLLSDDDTSHFYAGVGMKLLIQTKPPVQ